VRNGKAHLVASPRAVLEMQVEKCGTDSTGLEKIVQGQWLALRLYPQMSGISPD
jgi:hypothetical protein